MALSAYCAHIENVKDVLVHVIIYASLQEKRGGEGTQLILVCFDVAFTIFSRILLDVL